jgi:2-keto-4-pentenoate hydratase
MSAEALARTPEERLCALGLELPALRPRSGRYRGWVRSGQLLVLSGQGADGWVGRVGDDVTLEQGRLAARDCALNLLAQARDALGSLDRIGQVVKVLGYVCCSDDFTRAPAVVDGASDLLIDVLGAAGEHARAAIGVQALPLGFAVEVEMVLEIDEDGHLGLARRLLAADAAAEPIRALVAERPDLDVAGAYAIQRAGRRLRLDAGARLVGRKVGLTSAAMQEQLGVDQPDFGYLTDAMVLEDGGPVSRRELIAPRVEGEIAFRLARPLRGEQVTAADVLAATEAVAPALEVIDSRIADWQITIADTIADNASSARVALGAFRALDGRDLAAVELELEVGPRDGAAHHRVTGRGDAVLGHPAEAVAWLVRALAPYGEGVQAGEVVLPGAMARAVPFEAGDRISAGFGWLGDVVLEVGP